MRFIADSNVGKLARWLRVLGQDTLFVKDVDDDELLDIALCEDRIVLTRDTRLMNRRVITSGKLQALLVQDDDPHEQLRRVISELHLDACETRFTRCLECNVVLEPREKDEIRHLVPPYVFVTHEKYMQCPHCGRVYWRGTHWQRMNSRLEDLAQCQ